MLIQGSNNPLIVQFDADVSETPELVITLWQKRGYASEPVKTWWKSDMLVNGDTVACAITEDETAALPAGGLVIEAKGLNNDGYTIFWAAYDVDLLTRRDKVIRLTQAG